MRRFALPSFPAQRTCARPPNRVPSKYVEAADGCDYCRAGDGKPSVYELTTKINQQLARRGQAQVETSDQSVLKFEPMVHLVTAAYAKNEDGMTSGLSIALVVNQDGSVDLPREHLLFCASP